MRKEAVSASSLHVVQGSTAYIFREEDGSSLTNSILQQMSGMKYTRPEVHLRQNHIGENPFMKLNHPNANDIS